MDSSFQILNWLHGARRLAAMVMVSALALSGCGGETGGTSTTGTTGQVAVSLTDAPGDFIAYSVDVLSITLTRANGTTVEVLPVKSRVDFAQYTEMTEFVTIATIPSGVYTGARMRLDYSTAQIMVEDATGNAVAAVAKDTGGNAISILDLQVKFDLLRPLTVVAGVPAHLTLDFNLAASNQVNLVATPPEVTVSPFMIADINPEWHKTHRVRGPLVHVDTGASRFSLGIRPLALVTGDLGRLAVSTDGSTQFEVDQVSYAGVDGLNALALKTAGTATVVIGEVDPGTRRFLASEVYAGSSVPYGTSDVVTGTVLARSGDVLTLKGATLERANGTIAFQEMVLVTVADTTKVTRSLAPGQTFSKQDISVGQRLFAFGSLSGTVGSQALDATTGLARMLVSSLSATVNVVGSEEIELKLQTINGRRAAMYNFAGTGSGTDADPDHYHVATGSLGLDGIGAGTPIRVRGFPRALGAAPADFSAITLINVTSAPALLITGWTPSTANPFAALSSTGLSLNLAGSPLVHHIVRGGVLTDLAGTSPAISPMNATGLYGIGIAGTVTVYTNFSDYAQALSGSLTDGHKARGFGGLGNYTDAGQQFAGRHLFAAFE